MPRITQLIERLSASVSLVKKSDPVKSLYDFRTSRQTYQQRSNAATITELQRALWELGSTVQGNPKQAVLLTDALRLSYQLNTAASGELPSLTARLRSIAEQLPDLPVQIATSFTLPKLPSEIQAEIHADAEELEKCFAANAYRSCVVLCGRILETALHRKYFDATQHDVLEKSPGIGLGNLIAKMKEKGITLDPALANQIHLINQVRIFSVHKKQEAFTPNKNQAQAIMLYTMDTVGKLFGKYADGIK